MKPKFIIILALAGLVALSALYSCRLSPKARLKRTIARGIEAVENKDLPAILDLLHPAFTCDWVDRALLEQAIAHYWQNMVNLELRMIEDQFIVEGDEGLVVYRMVIVEFTWAKDADAEVPPRDMTAEKDLVLQWRKTADGWKLYRAGRPKPDQPEETKPANAYV